MAANKSIVMEVKSMQRLLKELHGKLEPDRVPVKVSSWKFPGKSAVDVDIDFSLQADPMREERSFLLELLIDRLMLLLQTFIVMSDATSSRASSIDTLPLTVSTAAKRVSKSLASKRRRIEQVPVVDCCPILAPKCTTSSVDISCQTHETAFTTCEYCSGKTNTLVSVAHRLGHACYSMCGNSQLAQTNWRRLVDSGKFKEMNIVEAINKDIELLSTCHDRLKSTQVTQQETIQHQEVLISQLQTQCTGLCEDMSQLQKKLDVTEVNCQKSAEKSFTDKIHELARKLNSEVIKSELLLKESTNLKKTESELRMKIAAQGEMITQVNRLIEQSQTSEQKLQKLNSELTKRVTGLEEDIKSQMNRNEELNEGMDRGDVLLRKAQAQISNLSQKCKHLMSEQTVLVARIKELDDQCILLDEQFGLMKVEKFRIDEQLQEATDLIKKYQAEIGTEKEKQMSMFKEKCNLQQQIHVLKDKLHEESSSKQLLMEYPYTCNIDSLRDATDERKCVSANVVRILMLEEQNLELRERSRLQMSSSMSNCEAVLELKHPIRLWQSVKCLSQNISSSPVSNRPPFRGQIRHLVAALNHGTVGGKGHAGEWDHQQPLETFLCSQCDAMCLSEHELESHACDIEAVN